jgi:hypothetical protein
MSPGFREGAQLEEVTYKALTLESALNTSRMPHQPTVTDIRFNTIIACLTPAVTLLNELNDASGPPICSAHINHHPVSH